MKHKLFRHNLTALLAACLITLANARSMAADLAGSVQGAGEPIAGSTVTLFAAGSGAPKQLAQSKTDDNGAFKLAMAQAPADNILYVVAKGGIPKAAANKGPNDAIGLMAVLGSSLPDKVTVNEFTTIASVWTSAQFLKGDVLRAGDNFIVGAQNQDALWAGNLSKFAPNGRAMSPQTSGFTGGWVEGIGFGLAIDAEDNCWATTNGSRAIVKFDKTGKPPSPPDGTNAPRWRCRFTFLRARNTGWPTKSIPTDT
jgi:hypothetical protein